MMESMLLMCKPRFDLMDNPHSPDCSRFENMAAQMGVNAEAFTTMHQDQMRSIRLHFVQYIKNLHQRKGVPTNEVPVRSVIEVTPRGFPIVPDIVFEMVKKEEVEDLMRDYLSKHYSMVFDAFAKLPISDMSTELACGQTRVPFSSLAADTSKFISSSYLPESFFIRDPRNLKKGHIEAFFSHLKARQAKYGVEDTFCFHQYKGKGEEYYEARYPKALDVQQEGQASPKKRQAKKRMDNHRTASTAEAAADMAALSSSPPSAPKLAAPNPAALDSFNTTAPNTMATNSTATNSTASSSTATTSTASNSPATTSTATNSTATKSTARKSTATKSTARKSTATKSTARKSTARSAAPSATTQDSFHLAAAVERLKLPTPDTDGDVPATAVPPRPRRITKKK
jgi:hypothetical protein